MYLFRTWKHMLLLGIFLVCTVISLLWYFVLHFLILFYVFLDWWHLNLKLYTYIFSFCKVNFFSVFHIILDCCHPLTIGEWRDRILINHTHTRTCIFIIVISLIKIGVCLLVFHHTLYLHFFLGMRLATFNDMLLKSLSDIYNMEESI